MATFRDENYWGQNKTPSTQAQLQNVPRSAAQIVAEAKSGKIPTVSEVQMAIKSLTQGRGGQKLTPEDTANLDFLMYKVPQIAAKPQMYNDPSMAFASKPTAGPSFLSKILPSVGSIGKGIGAAAKTGMGAMGDIAQAALGGSAEDESPEALYRRLREAAGEFTYSGPSAEEMATQEFNPQFQLLDQIKKQTGDRYASNKKDIAGMYSGLVNDMTAGRGQDKAMFDQTGQQIKGNYTAAADQVSKGATAYSTAMAQELARLGIKEGAGDVLASTQANLQDNLGRLASQGQTSTNLNSQLGANEFAYDTNNIGLSKQAGINTQNDFMQQMMEAMAQNDNQRLGLTGQKQQAQNAYGMQIQDLLQKGRASFEDSILGQFKGIQDANQQQSNDFYRQAELDLKQNQFGYQQQQDALKSGGNLSAYDALAQKALGVYGNDPVKSRQAIDQVLAAYQNNPNVKTVGDFLNTVDPQELAANPELKSLMFDFIQKMIEQQQQ